MAPAARGSPAEILIEMTQVDSRKRRVQREAAVNYFRLAEYPAPSIEAICSSK